MSENATYELVKKLVKIVIWFCFFTFFISNPSWVSSFFNSFISHISTFPSLLLSHINNKNYVFLLCNGILVILAKSSRKLSNDSSVSCNKTDEVPLLVEQDEEKETRVLQNHGVMIGTEPRVKEIEFHVEEEGEKREEFSSDEYCCIEVENDADEQESIARMSTEDLNRKFDEFIRRMKEEIRVEAQQQLIMV